MPKVQLGTRIPENLDLDIENMAKDKGMKKQDLVIQLLSLGLAMIGNVKAFTEYNRADHTESDDNSLSLIKSDPRVLSEGTLLANESPTVKNHEERLTDLEMAVKNLSHQTAELKKIVEPASASDQSSDSSSKTTEKFGGKRY